MMRITICKDCKYRGITYTEICSKCGGELEVIAEEIIEEKR